MHLPPAPTSISPPLHSPVQQQQLAGWKGSDLGEEGGTRKILPHSLLSATCRAGGGLDRGMCMNGHLHVGFLGLARNTIDQPGSTLLNAYNAMHAPLINQELHYSLLHASTIDQWCMYGRKAAISPEASHLSLAGPSLLLFLSFPVPLSTIKVFNPISSLNKA